MRRPRPILARGVFVLLLLVPQAAWSTTIGTNVSGPTTGDAASIYWNPAAMTLVPGTAAMTYGGLSIIRARYRSDYPDPDTGKYGRASEVAPTPDLFVGAVTNATLKRFRFGLGFTAPLIDGAMWSSTENGEPSPARYYGLHSHLAWLTLSPAVAYKIHRFLSIGFGIDVTIALLQNRSVVDFGAKINQMACQLAGTKQCPFDAPLPRNDPTFDASLSANGTGWGAGVFGGILFTPTPWLRVGAAIHSGAGKVEIPTSILLEMPTVATEFVQQNLPSVALPPIEEESTVTVHSPMSVTAGVLWTPLEQLDLSLDFQWIDKSSMSTIQTVIHRKPTTPAFFTDKVTFNPYYDLFCVRATGAYRILETLGLSLSLTYEPNTRAERMASPTTIDMHKVLLRAGVAWEISRRVTVAADYGHYFLVTREIKQTMYAPNANPITPEEEAMDKSPATGTYSAEADRFALGVLVSF